MKENIDYINLMNIAKINLSNCINDNMELYKKQKNPETKRKLMNLIYDRKNIFLFDKETIKKYL